MREDEDGNRGSVPEGKGIELLVDKVVAVTEKGKTESDSF
jgi:hypothetical protein